jgi:hypothetical protein
MQSRSGRTSHENKATVDAGQGVDTPKEMTMRLNLLTLGANRCSAESWKRASECVRNTVRVAGEHRASG